MTTTQNMIAGAKSIIQFLEREIGWPPSPRTLQRWIREAKDPLPAYRLRGTLVAIIDEVRAWLRRNLMPVVTA